ncbi:unnamed protein product [Spodoptera littoralis]|uniref:Uncharacterized protein n=1 Tax=Spodoptera littoralis TaxID=7109 RepID=A0A9P0HWR4_SPOLI|nr:unnamed protein product [Spodoptera littoralis]CAH1635936.1 unnamed protein product [Spodoptera littoralis]
MNVQYVPVCALMKPERFDWLARSARRECVEPEIPDASLTICRYPTDHINLGVHISGVELQAVKIATESKLQLCGGWSGQASYALDGCVDAGLLRPPPQPHSSQLGTVYATKRRRRNGKRELQMWYPMYP